MLRLLIDQDFNYDVLRGLTTRTPGLDAVTAHQAGLSSASDPELLAWAASEGRILVTHDKKTMPDHAAERLASGEQLIIPRRLRTSEVIAELEVIVECSEADDWEGVIKYLPL
jgi:predicted nuclease of predicted toxin-antitoxin system